MMGVFRVNRIRTVLEDLQPALAQPAQRVDTQTNRMASHHVVSATSTA